MQGIGLTTSASVEIISAYTATNQTVPAVLADPGWYVVGTFFLSTTSEAQLEVLGSVSDSALVMTVRLFDLVDAAPVVGASARITSVVDSRTTSGIVTLQGGRSYQVQAEAVGGAGDAFFGSMRSATLI